MSRSFTNKLLPFLQCTVTIWFDAMLHIAFEYIAVLQYVIRLIKEHIMSLKLAKKLSRNVKLYCIFLVQLFLQCNNWILTTWKAKNVTMYCNISIFFIRRIVLYCSNEYCNISIYCSIIASLLHCVQFFVILLTSFSLREHKLCIVFFIMFYVIGSRIKDFSPSPNFQQVSMPNVIQNGMIKLTMVST